MEYDVAIVGLGPAGSTLARFLPQRMRVLCLDKKQKDEDTGFRKPCGGLLAPDAQKSLSRMGLTLPSSILVDPQIFSVHTLDLATGLSRHYQRHYMNIDRHRFDQWLISMIPSRAEIKSGAVCVRIKRIEGGFQLIYRQGSLEAAVTAQYVVGADGANSIVRRSLFPKNRTRRYMAIQQWFKDEHPSPFYSCVFDASATDCYSWGLSKDGFFLFGGAFPETGARAAFDSQKQRLKEHGFCLGEPVKTQACFVLRPLGPLDFCPGKDGAFLVGEAAGFISPSSLEGISYAIDSGYLLSQTLGRTDDPNRAYRAKTRKMRMKLVGKNLKSPFMYHPLLRALVMKSGLKAIKIVEPDGD